MSEDLWWTILGFICAWEMPVKEEATQQSNSTEDGLCSQLQVFRQVRKCIAAAQQQQQQQQQQYSSFVSCHWRFV